MSAYPLLIEVEWARDGVRHTWQHRVEAPPTEADRALLEAAAEQCGINAAIAALVADGVDPVTAARKVYSYGVVDLVQRSIDEAAYERECARKGLLPL